MLLKRLLALFGEKPPKKPPHPFQEVLKDSPSNEIEAQMNYELGMLEVMSETMSKPLPCVILQPRVPHGGLETEDSWFGGAPRLPAGVEWPSIGGKPGYFVAQINLSALPKELWSGLGPRSGWISIFMAPVWGLEPVVLFNEQLGEPRDGPDQGDTDWFRPSRRETPPYSTLPEWPIDIITHSQLDGRLKAPVGYNKGMAPDFPDPRADIEFDLTRHEFQPVNHASAKLLFELLIKEIETGRKPIERFRENPDTGNKLVNPDDLDVFETAINTSTQKIEEIREQLLSDPTAPMSSRSIEQATSCLSKVEIPRLKVEEVKDVDRGADDRQPVHLVMKTKPAHLSGRPESYWDGGYQRMLYEHAKHIYANDPASFSKEQRKWWETIFAFDACYEIGAMGHMPRGQLDYFHGPETGMEVLIELKTSDLNGWIWGDMYSVVLLIPTNNLREGHFEGVVAGITN